MTINVMGNHPPLLVCIAILLAVLGPFIVKLSRETRAWIEMRWAHSASRDCGCVADYVDQHESMNVHVRALEDPPEQAIPLAG
jgi:hypothetical protein